MAGLSERGVYSDQDGYVAPGRNRGGTCWSGISSGTFELRIGSNYLDGEKCVHADDCHVNLSQMSSRLIRILFPQTLFLITPHPKLGARILEVCATFALRLCPPL